MIIITLISFGYLKSDTLLFSKSLYIYKKDESCTSKLRVVSMENYNNKIFNEDSKETVNNKDDTNKDQKLNNLDLEETVFVDQTIESKESIFNKLYNIITEPVRYIIY